MGRRANDGGYLSADGRPVPSVSTVIRTCYGGDEAAQWANRLGLEGIRYDLELEWRAQVGTLAHWYAEHGLGLAPKGRPPGIDTGNAARDERGVIMASASADRMIEWWRAQGMEVYAHEQPYIHPVLDYGGTPDIIGWADGGLVVVDWKTSSRATRRHRLQVGAYCAAVQACTGLRTTGMVVCAPISGGDLTTSKVAGAMLDRMTGAFGHLRLAYGFLSRESMGGKDNNDED